MHRPASGSIAFQLMMVVPGVGVLCRRNAVAGAAVRIELHMCSRAAYLHQGSV